jgi:6-phosphogluconolactonase
VTGPVAALPGGSEIVADADVLAQAAALRVVEALAARRIGPVGVALSGGTTPRRLYRLLAGPHRGEIDWARVHWFWSDERLVPRTSDDSNSRMAMDAMLHDAPAPHGNVHPVVTAGVRADDSARLYETELETFYGDRRLDPARPLFTIVLLGMGEDGHTASLFPGKPAIEETRRWAVGVPEAGQPPFVPRVTLTRAALASAGLTLFLVSGPGKHAALGRVAAGEPLPAARVAAESPNVAWLLDRAAATGEPA